MLIAVQPLSKHLAASSDYSNVDTIAQDLLCQNLRLPENESVLGGFA